MSALTSIAPSVDEMYLTAEKCFADLPEFMRKAAGDVRILVMEFAEDEILDEMGIDDALELTGLYSGIPLTLESVTNPTVERPLIYIYRLPILFEWAQRGDVTVEELVTHVFIHELGHHFGWSDEEIDAKLEEDDDLG
ncbi:metallopeptidase family protein [Hyphomonas sp. WL0036]|uniref:metallopeptidase family protein n=1 Tax=Hyphomonas sediminis TaxID=2866160 RepID=UPI001C80391A|nr:metallopeptidase family protein [Hyphomonas sediminis]MBY9067317.1 metallopeptidase family protein [Hyphomonas sediminis]